MTAKRKSDIRVLYVEDDPSIFERWAKWFRKSYSEQSDHVRSKDEAKELVLKRLQDYDIAFVDLGIPRDAESTVSLPEIGLSLINLIGDRVPCVMCSGSIDGDIYRASKAAGFLEKPYRENQVEEIIVRILGVGEGEGDTPP